MSLVFPTLFFLAIGCTSVSAGLVDDSLHQADQWWDKTREYAGTTLEHARRLWHEDHSEDAQLWEALLPRLDNIISLQERQRKLPESAWLGEDQASNAARIDTLLDEAVTILIGENRFRLQIGELERAMADNRRAVSELQRRKMTAPSDSLWRKTVQDIEQEIAERERVLNDQQQELVRIRNAFAAQLQEVGLDIDAGRLEFLLSTVVGDEVVDMTLAFEQVRRLTEQLEALTLESRENLPTARRYYGMYTVLLKVLVRMHDDLLHGIDQRYLPQIAAIKNRARELRQQTRALQARAPSPVLKANLDAQQLTLDAAGRYADYLKQQRQQVAASRERLSQDLAVALNTYETVKVSGDLVALMKDSRRLLDTLFSLQVPRLRAFENLEMKREFERLTASLRREGET
jgi:hypothetical protein